jgi:poly(A) polymerase
VRRLATLLKESTQAEAVALRLRFSNKDRERIEALASPEPRFVPPPDERAVRRACYRLGPELLVDRALLHWANAGTPDNAALERILDEVEAWEPLALPVKGEDVLALGVPTGEAVGSALRQIEEWWIGEDFRPGRDEALARLKEVIGPRAA